MTVPKLTNGTFSLRDYVAYLFPGVCLLACLALARPELWKLIASDPIAASVVLLVGGYIAGLTSHRASHITFCRLLDKIQGIPNEGMLRPETDSQRKLMDNEFRKILLARLEEVWGEEILAGREDNILFLCWRELQLQDNASTAYLERLVDLYNMATSLLFPTSLMSVVLLVRGEYLESSFVFLVFFSMSVVRFKYRAAFARNVYRSWFVSHRSGTSSIS